MKKLLLLFAISIGLGALKAQIPSNGLIAHYPLGMSQSTGNATVGTHKDISVNSYSLSFSNGFGFGANRANVANEAAAFNGISSDTRRFDYSATPAAFQQTGNFTICAWVRIGSIATEYSSIVQVGNNDIFLRFRFTGSGDFIQGGFRTGASSFAVLSSSIIRSNFTNNWALIMLRRTGAQMEILVNNIQIGTNNFTTGSILHGTSNRFFTVGNSIDPNTCIIGRMQDVLYYSRSLTSLEASAIFNHCSGAATNITPEANLSICTGNSTNLSVLGSNISWFDVLTGGTALDTGNNFTTPILTGSTTYYAQQGNCLNRQAITVTVLPAIALTKPTVMADTATLHCTGNQVQLTVNEPGTNFRWYNVASGGNVLGSGRTYTTPSLQNTAGQGQTSTQTYYVESFNACSNPNTSARTAVVLKVGSPNFTFSNTSSAGSYYACSGSSSTFSIVSNATNIQWLSNGVLLGTGNVFTTPIFANSDSSYLAKIFNASGCVATLSFPVKVYTKQTIAPINLTPSSPAICPGDSITLKASSTAGIPLTWLSNMGIIGFGDSIRILALSNNPFYVRTGTSISCFSPVTNVTVNLIPTPTGTIHLSGTTISANNLFDSYTLYRNDIQVAQSNSSGTFSYTNATCGSYKAVFSNTVNSCPASVNLLMRRVNQSIGCDRIFVTHASGIVFPATIQVRKGGGTYTAPVQMNLTGETVFSNICTVVGGTNNLEVRITSANGCTFLFNKNTNNVTTNSTPSLQFADYLEGDLLTTCPIRSNIINITINNPVNTTSTSNRGACFGRTTTLTASGNGTLTWFNQAVGGNPIGTGNSFVTPAITASTTFYVEATSGTCKSERVAIPVTLNPQPVLAMDRSIDTTICEGETVFLNASFNNPINVTWIPNVGPSTDVKPSATTTYTVSVGNVWGCTASSSITIVVTPKIITPINASICFGETYIFKGQPLNTSGQYRDTLPSSLGCDSIIIVNLSVNPLPQPTITQNGNVLSTQSFSGYQWQLNNVNIPNANSQNYTATQNGDYTVTVTDANSCSKTSASVNVTASGLRDAAYHFVYINMYPNPATDVLEITCDQNIESIEVRDITGRIIPITHQLTTKHAQLETSGLAQATYFVVLKTSNGQSAVKAFVKN